MELINRILSEMTLEEKVGQLNLVTAGQAVTGPVANGDMTENIRAGFVGGVFNLWGRDAVRAAQKLAVEESRLSVPLFFGLDVLHGHRTIFPVPLAEAGAFDVELWGRTARAAAVEAAADGIDLTFAPMLDVARDPRWGRIVEAPGEDPLVAAEFAAAKVKGFQGEGLSAQGSIAATAKHFVGGGAALAGREYAAADISERTLHEVYLPPFAAAVAAGCAAIMPAFNSVAGVPMTAHAELLRGYLRTRLAFEGVIISDYTAVPELVQHGVAADLVEAAALALKAGIDVDMVSGAYLHGLPQALERGLIEETDIDAAVRRVLTLKRNLGLFENPYRRLDASEAATCDHGALALEAARRSITLLTNRDILPLPADVRRIAVVGPLADARAEMLGPWCAAGRAESCVTILEGLRAALPAREIRHHPGVAIEGDDCSGVDAACALCATVDAVVLCVGESAGMSGEAASRASPGLPGRQREFAEAILATGAPVIAVLSSGRPLIASWLIERARATLATWLLGDMAGKAVADVLTGRFNPTARLAATWPREVGQIPIFYATRSSGRPPDAGNPFTSRYLDIPTEPLFPFGHGLSYAQVQLYNLRTNVERFEIRDDAELEVRVDVANRGTIATEETVFLFVRDPVASVARPAMELKAWAKSFLDAGAAKTTVFTLSIESFSFPGKNMQRRCEPGAFEILVGLNADPKTLRSIRVEAVPTPNPQA
ncbi:MAG TPA: glycoside hydrolase family 3 N-terminal domain-containing protein [Methylocystis sp.]|nr:glycoside hydrolase family 3 N-terminal domain-containing protein [Methylocystis sp.]